MQIMNEIMVIITNILLEMVLNCPCLTRYPKMRYIPYIPPLNPRQYWIVTPLIPFMSHTSVTKGSMNARIVNTTVAFKIVMLSKCFNAAVTNGIERYIPIIIGIYHIWLKNSDPASETLMLVVPAVTSCRKIT